MPRFSDKRKCEICGAHVVSALWDKHQSRHERAGRSAPSVDLAAWFAGPTAKHVEDEREAARHVDCPHPGCGYRTAPERMGDHLEDHARREARARVASERMARGEATRRSRYEELRRETGYTPDRVKKLVERCAREVAESWDDGALLVTDPNAEGALLELKRHMQRANDLDEYALGRFADAARDITRDFLRRQRESGWKIADDAYWEALRHVEEEVKGALLAIVIEARRGRAMFPLEG